MRITYLLLALLILGIYSLNGQTTDKKTVNIIENLPNTGDFDTTPDKNPIIEVPQQQAQFPGGMSALYEYLSKNLQYPAAARDYEIQGRVIVSFVVEKNGQLSDVKVLKSLDPACDEEAVRLIKSMPAWIPAKQGDMIVRSRMILPVIIKLDNK